MVFYAKKRNRKLQVANRDIIVFCHNNPLYRQAGYRDFKANISQATWVGVKPTMVI